MSADTIPSELLKMQIQRTSGSGAATSRMKLMSSLVISSDEVRRKMRNIVVASGASASGLPSTIICRTSSGRCFAISRAMTPPWLQPIIVAGSPCFSTTFSSFSSMRFS